MGSSDHPTKSAGGARLRPWLSCGRAAGLGSPSPAVACPCRPGLVMESPRALCPDGFSHPTGLCCSGWDAPVPRGAQGSQQSRGQEGPTGAKSVVPPGRDTGRPAPEIQHDRGGRGGPAQQQPGLCTGNHCPGQRSVCHSSPRDWCSSGDLGTAGCPSVAAGGTWCSTELCWAIF